MVEHMNERIAMFIMCACTLIVCSVSVWCSLKSHQGQEKLRQEVLDRIDLVMNQGGAKLVDRGKIVEQSNGRMTIRKERQSFPNSTVGYSPVPSFVENGISPPSANRDVALV